MLTLAEQLDAALHSAAMYTLSDRAFLRITGSDATRWLNGMVTNNIATLVPSEGNYNFLLNAQGRIQGDCMIYREHDQETAAFLLATESQQIETIHTLLDKFIIMDDVELSPIRAGEESLFLVGPKAEMALTSLGLTTLATNRSAVASTSEGPVAMLTSSTANLFEVRVEVGQLDFLVKKLQLPEISAEAIEALRILEGRPRYGVDIRNSESARDLPQETAQTQALNFNKGCYVGQEIVERIHSRGQVHRTFSGFRFEGALPNLPTALTVLIDGVVKTMGELTSAASIPLATGEILLALGYVRREALDRGDELTYDGGQATAVPVPFTLE